MVVVTFSVFCTVFVTGPEIIELLRRICVNVSYTKENFS